MAKFHRLNVPSFDLTWLNLSEHDQVALIAGGGGSFKSGVVQYNPSNCLLDIIIYHFLGSHRGSCTVRY
mgnify:CR=1 FL=1